MLFKSAKYTPKLGAGVLFLNSDGSYLLQKNHKEPGFPDHLVGKLRPAGGGKSKTDKDLHATIVREIDEEFGLTADKVIPNLRLLGYIRRGGYKDCAMFEMQNHGLTAKTYYASNSKYEKVKLVKAELSAPGYIGEKPQDLRPAKEGEYGYVDKELTKKAAVSKATFVTRMSGKEMLNSVRNRFLNAKDASTLPKAQQILRDYGYQDIAPGKQHLVVVNENRLPLSWDRLKGSTVLKDAVDHLGDIDVVANALRLPGAKVPTKPLRFDGSQAIMELGV